MSIIAVDNFGTMTVDYDAGTPLPNESHTIQSPDTTQWELLADGGTGIITVTSGASGTPETYAILSPNGVEWLVSVDDGGIISLTSFEGAIVFAPVINGQFKVDGVPAAGYRLFAYEAGSIPPVSAIVYKNGTFIDTQSIPIVLNSYGFPTDPVFIKIGKRYKFELYPPDDPTPVRVWDYVSGGISVDISTPTEFVDPPILATFSGLVDTFVLQGDHRSTFKSGRRVKCSGVSIVYGTIFSSIYDGVNTTVVIVADSGSLDGTFTSVAYALLSPSSSAVPSRRMVGMRTILRGILTVAAANGLNLLPVSMIALRKSPAPTGWLECNGAAVSRTTYAALFAAVGTTFGAGNGTTTFNLPNLTPPASLIYVVFAKA